MLRYHEAKLDVLRGIKGLAKDSSTASIPFIFHYSKNKRADVQNVYES